MSWHVINVNLLPGSVGCSVVVLAATTMLQPFPGKGAWAAHVSNQIYISISTSKLLLNQPSQTGTQISSAPPVTISKSDKSIQQIVSMEKLLVHLPSLAPLFLFLLDARNVFNNLGTCVSSFGRAPRAGQGGSHLLGQGDGACLWKNGTGGNTRNLYWALCFCSIKHMLSNRLTRKHATSNLNMTIRSRKIIRILLQWVAKGCKRSDVFPLKKSNQVQQKLKHRMGLSLKG